MDKNIRKNERYSWSKGFPNIRYFKNPIIIFNSIINDILKILSLIYEYEHDWLNHIKIPYNIVLIVLLLYYWTNIICIKVLIELTYDIKIFKIF